jgi:hypothetical protein
MLEFSRFFNLLKPFQMSFFLPSSSEYSTNFQSSASIPSSPLTVETTSGPATVSLVHPSHPPPNWQINLIEINPTLKLLRTFNADDFLRIDCSKKGSFKHPLRPYSPNRPNNLILIMREKIILLFMTRSYKWIV